MGERRVGFVFPGAGVKPCGHEASFLRRHAARLGPLLDRGSEACGADLRSAVLDGSELGELAEQLYAYCFQCGVARVLRDHGIAPALLAGHSLGIYAALTVSGAIEFESGLALTERAYTIAQRVCAGGAYGMAIVIGLEEAELRTMLGEPSYASIRLASRQNPLSHVFSGPRTTLGAFVGAALEREAYRARLLDIGFPYHHPEIMADVTTELGRVLGEFEWQTPVHPVVSSIDRKILTRAEELRDFTARNLSTPLSWQGVMEVMVREGMESAIECGPGWSLTVSGRMLPEAPRLVHLKSLRGRFGV